MFLIYFSLFLMVFFVIYDKLTKKYVNPYKLIMIFGKKGSGKTTTLTSIAIKNLKKGVKVYSTVKIPSTYYFDVSQIGKMTFEPDSVVLIDEVGMIWDNRDFGNFKPNVRDFFKLQRQYKLTIYLFSQCFDIDKKLRDLTDEMYLLTNVMRVFSVQRRIIKRITISNASENGSGTSSLVDEYKFDWLIGGGLKVVFIPRWVSFFKSYNPKKLTYIEGQYCDLNELQERYISNKNWLKDMFKIGFTHCITFVRAIPNECMKSLNNTKELFTKKKMCTKK